MLKLRCFTVAAARMNLFKVNYAPAYLSLVPNVLFF